jgi:lipoate-protein ligase A
MISDLFPFQTADGPTQMAADEVLLEHAIATGRPALRFYTWERPTLSLGYFQSFADRFGELPVVRRMTGGGAIIHDRELTYGLALPSGATLKEPIPAHSGGHSVQWVCMIHDVVRAALRVLGVTASAGCSHEFGRGKFLCFEHQTPGDLLLGGHKIGGSAQRRRAGALLQHGSVLLAASPHAPQLLGVRELAGTILDPAGLAEEVTRALVQKTGWTMMPCHWSKDMISWQEQLAADRYRNPGWTERR